MYFQMVLPIEYEVFLSAVRAIRSNRGLCSNKENLLN